MGNGPSIPSTGISIYNKITKKPFETGKSKRYQSCQSFKQSTRNSEDNSNDINDEKWVHSIDQTIQSYQVESFYYDEDYLDKVEDADNKEHIINNETQSFKLEQTKLEVNNTVEGDEPYDTLNNNDNSCEYKEANDYKLFLQCDNKQFDESLKDNMSENSNKTILSDLNNSCTIEYFKTLEYPNLLQNDSPLSITSMNSLNTKSILNNQQKFQEQHNTTNIQDSISCLTSPIDKSELDSTLVIQSSTINNGQSQSNFTPLIDNVQSYLNPLKHNVYVQCNMNGDRLNKLKHQENEVSDIDKHLSVKLEVSNRITMKNKNKYYEIMKLSEKFPIISMNNSKMIDFTKYDTTTCSEINHDKEEYLSLNNVEFDQTYHERFQLQSGYDPFDLDKTKQFYRETDFNKEYNRHNQIDHRNLMDTSSQNNDEYEIMSFNHELNSQLEGPISIDINKDGYIYTPIVMEKLDSSTINTTDEIQSIQTVKKCMKTTESYFIGQVLLKDTNEIEMNKEYIDNKDMIEKDNILDNYKKSMLVDNELSNPSTVTKTITECTTEFHRPIYVHVVSSLHHD
ncbi:unnamed protein product [Schistosoma margrebowiei]|uniref:Uncharacterized protein n=1 Tax=Schistosoma margrebowiei TaxID=48269 RepID=A0AA85AKJ9_9TREM|nr:unnamed protein product [Schistosoma margrebowiei]